MYFEILWTHRYNDDNLPFQQPAAVIAAEALACIVNNVFSIFLYILSQDNSSNYVKFAGGHANSVPVDTEQSQCFLMINSF